MIPKRPKINVPLLPFDLWVDRFSFLIFFLIWLYTIVNFANLPDTIPLHFDAKGNADGFGSKQNVWLLLGLMTLLFVGIHILGKHPHLHSYTVAITEENALKNYRFSSRILRIVNFFDLLLFAYIIKKTVTFNDKEIIQPDSWFLPIVLGSSSIFLIAIFIYTKKINSK